MPAIQSNDEVIFSPRTPRRGVPLVRAALAQVAAGLLVVAYMNLVGQLPYHPLVVQGIVAGVVGQALRLPLWWLPINIAFVPSAAAVQTLQISPLWFLAAFAGLLIVFWNTFRTRVPLYLSSGRACSRLAQMLPADATARILDLGCGFGGVMLALRRLRPAVRLVGLELAPLPAWLARLRLRRDANSTVRRRDFWEEDFSDYDVVYAFLSPEPMEQLWAKARSQMRPGSLFISNSFEVPGVPPDLTLPLKSTSGRALYVWRMRS